MDIVASKDYAVAETFLQGNFSSPTHWPDWNICVSKEFGTEFFYLFAYQGKELIGIYPKHRVRHGRFLFREYSGQFHLIPFGGWIFSKPVDVSDEMMNYSDKVLVNSLSYSLPGIPEFNAEFSNLEGAKMQTLAIRLTQNLEQIWENEIHSKRRNMIRKAEKEGVRIHECGLAEGLNDFYELYEASAKRFTSFVLSRQFFESMTASLKNISVRIFSALIGDELIANVIVVADKNFCIYWMGNNLSHARNLGQGDALQWAVIQSMKSFGCKYYDLCYIEPERLPAIYEFKRGFAKTAYPITQVGCSSLGYRIINRIF